MLPPTRIQARVVTEALRHSDTNTSFVFGSFLWGSGDGDYIKNDQVVVFFVSLQ